MHVLTISFQIVYVKRFVKSFCKVSHITVEFYNLRMPIHRNCVQVLCIYVESDKNIFAIFLSKVQDNKSHKSRLLLL